MYTQSKAVSLKSVPWLTASSDAYRAALCAHSAHHGLCRAVLPGCSVRRAVSRSEYSDVPEFFLSTARPGMTTVGVVMLHSSGSGRHARPLVPVAADCNAGSAAPCLHLRPEAPYLSDPLLSDRPDLRPPDFRTPCPPWSRTDRHGRSSKSERPKVRSVGIEGSER